MVTVLAFDLHAIVLLALVLNHLGHFIPTKVGVVRIGHSACVARPLVLHKDLVFLHQ